MRATSFSPPLCWSSGTAVAREHRRRGSSRPDNGERLRGGTYRVVHTNQSSAIVPLSLSLPHKGGGNVVALVCPSPRNAPAYGSEMCACLLSRFDTLGTLVMADVRLILARLEPDWS